MKRRHKLQFTVKSVWRWYCRVVDGIEAAVLRKLHDHIPEAYANRPCRYCSYAVGGRMMWTVHEPRQPCPRRMVRWCMNCEHWTDLTSALRTACCLSLEWHPTMVWTAGEGKRKWARRKDMAMVRGIQTVLVLALLVSMSCRAESPSNSPAQESNSTSSAVRQSSKTPEPSAANSAQAASAPKASASNTPTHSESAGASAPSRSPTVTNGSAVERAVSTPELNTTTSSRSRQSLLTSEPSGTRKRVSATESTTRQAAESVQHSDSLESESDVARTIVPSATRGNPLQYGVVNPPPVKSDAELLAVFAPGDWLIVNQVSGRWQVLRPIPCHVTVTSVDPTATCYYVQNEWEGGICSRRLGGDSVRSSANAVTSEAALAVTAPDGGVSDDIQTGINVESNTDKRIFTDRQSGNEHGDGRTGDERGSAGEALSKRIKAFGAQNEETVIQPNPLDQAEIAITNALLAIKAARDRAVPCAPSPTPVPVFDAWLRPYYDPRGDPASGYPVGAILWRNIVTGQYLVTTDRSRYFKDGYAMYVLGAGPLRLRHMDAPDPVMQPGAYTQDCGKFSLTFNDADLIARFGGPYDNVTMKLPGLGDVPADRWSLKVVPEVVFAGTADEFRVDRTMVTYAWDYLPCGFEQYYWPSVPDDGGIDVRLCAHTATLDRPCVEPIGAR